MTSSSVFDLSTPNSTCSPKVSDYPLDNTAWGSDFAILLGDDLFVCSKYKPCFFYDRANNAWIADSFLRARSDYQGSAAVQIDDNTIWNTGKHLTAKQFLKQHFTLLKGENFSTLNLTFNFSSQPKVAKAQFNDQMSKFWLPWCKMHLLFQNIIYIKYQWQL